MNELKNKDTFTSLELTELINQYRREEGNKNELLHKNLMAVIRDEFQEEINQLKIQPVEYTDKKGEKRPMFILNLQQSRQVLVRESKFVRKAVIKYIDELESKLKGQFQVPTSFAEALRLAAEQQEKIEALRNESETQKQIIGELKPIKEYVDTILQSEDTMTISQIAADYGLSGIALNKILHEQELIRNIGGQWILYKNYMNRGYTKSETVSIKRKDNTDKIVVNTKWTQKGRLKIHEILTTLGIQANMDKEKIA